MWLDVSKVRLSVHAMMACGGVKAQIQSFLTSALDGDKWSISRPGHFLREKHPSTH
jgi:hypothetical protein